MLFRTKLVVASAGAALALSTGAGIASAQPGVEAVVNSTCTYEQVTTTLNDLNPAVAAELNTSPMASGWLQRLIAAPPDERRGMVQQIQSFPGLQPYLPVIYKVAAVCDQY